MYEETREQIKDIVFLARIEDIVSVAGIEDITYERFGGFALNKADLILAQLFTPAQIAEWKAGGKVGIIARDQELPFPTELPFYLDPTETMVSKAGVGIEKTQLMVYDKCQQDMVNDKYRRVVE